MSTSPTSRSAVPLRVHPNPFSALDLNGMPAGVVHFDPEHNLGNDIAHVGVQIARKPADAANVLARREHNRDTRYCYEHAFDLVVVEIPHTDYHVRQIKDGSLLCADAQTARTAGIKFVEPVAALAVARATVIADWVANYGVEPPIETWADFTIPGAEHVCAASDKRSAAVHDLSTPKFKSLNSDESGGASAAPKGVTGADLATVADVTVTKSKPTPVKGGSL